MDSKVRRSLQRHKLTQHVGEFIDGYTDSELEGFTNAQLLDGFADYIHIIAQATRHKRQHENGGRAKKGDTRVPSTTKERYGS